MSNPTGDALMARIKALETALKEVESYVNMQKQYSNYRTILNMIREVLD